MPGWHPIGEDIDFAKKTFENYSKDVWGIKVTKEKKGLIAKEVTTPVSDKRGDLRAVFLAEGNEVRIGVAYKLGYDIVINSVDYPEGMVKMKEFMRGYQEYHFTEYYSELIEKDEKSQRALQKELQKTEREISNLRKQVNNNQSKITKAKSESKKATLRTQSADKRSRIEVLSASIPKLNEEISHLDTSIENHQAMLDVFLVKLKDAVKADQLLN